MKSKIFLLPLSMLSLSVTFRGSEFSNSILADKIIRAQIVYVLDRSKSAKTYQWNIDDTRVQELHTQTPLCSVQVPSLWQSQTFL